MFKPLGSGGHSHHHSPRDILVKTRGIQEAGRSRRVQCIFGLDLEVWTVLESSDKVLDGASGG